MKTKETQHSEDDDGPAEKLVWSMKLNRQKKIILCQITIVL